MKPSARPPHDRRRLAGAALLLCGASALHTPASFADGPPQKASTGGSAPASPQCPAVPEDPRLEELRQGDPDSQRIDVTSDSGELGRAGDANLRGNVTIRMGQRLMRSDEADIAEGESSVTMRGEVEYLDPSLHVTGRGGTFERNGVGEFERAQFELLDRRVRGSARDAKMRQGGAIDLSGVRYTACPAGNEDWLLKAGQISIDQQKRAGTGRDVKLEFMGVPLFYSPWISFPVGEERKTGLLFPIFGTSNKTGTQLALPWYWDIAPNYDATFTARYFSKRGFRLDPEFRYMTEDSRGLLDAEYLFSDQQTGASRSLVEWQHVTRLEPRTRLLIDASHVSDSDYFEDFGVGFEGTSVIFLDRMLELRSDTDHWSLAARAQDYQVIDQLLADPDRPYTIAPQLSALGRWRDLPGGFEAGFSADATNFVRDVGPQGVRIDTEPSLGWRADRGGAYVAANAGWRYTQYSLDRTDPGADRTPSRDAPITSIDTGFALERTSGAHGERVQTLEPRLLYLYVPYRNQDALPVFDTAVPDLSLVQLFSDNRYVGADRLGDANQLAAGVTTRLLDATGGRQILSATLGQAIYFENPKVRLPDEPTTRRATSDVLAELDLAAFKNWNARFGYQWNPDLSQTEKSEVYLQYKPKNDQVVNLGYRFRHDLLEQFDVSTAWPIGRDWRTYARWVYSLRESKTLDAFAGLEYSSCCWALRVIARHYVSSRTGASDTSIGIQLELKGLSSVGIDYDSFLRNAIRGYSALPYDPRS